MKTSTTTLAQLKLNPEINPRHVDPNANVEDLKAQIREKGCIGQLWVRPAKKKGSFEIIAGSRRYAAMSQLAKSGEWKRDGKVPINIFDVDDAEAQELALGENFPREPLPPADEAVGFTRLRVSGMSVDEIATHFAVTGRLVLQRIAIGSLPAPILNALRDGMIDLGAAQHFTRAPAERALKIFKALSKKKTLRAYDVDEALEEGGVAGDDRRCLFVGAEDYQAAGGVVNSDLFSNNEMWSDEKLLDTLFEEKIAARAQQLKDEGWSFVEVLRKNAYAINSWAKSVAKDQRELTKEEKAELKKLKAEMKAFEDEAKALDDKYENADPEIWTDKDQERQDELVDLAGVLEEKIAEFEAPAYTPRQMAKAGCVITVDENGGRVKIVKGLLKPGTHKAKANGSAEDDDDPISPESAPGNAAAENLDYSEALTRLLELEAQKAAKLAMVTQKPALTARMGLTARIMASVERGHDAPFKVHHSDTDCGGAFEKMRDDGFETYRGDHSFVEIMGWLETLTPENIISIEAYLAADTFAISSLKNEDVKAVLEMIGPDMAAEGFKPDADFLGKLSRSQVEAIIAEIDPTAKQPKTRKKPDIITAALPLIEASGWLPPQLRTSHYAGPGSNAWADAGAAKSAEEISHQQAAE